MIDVLRSYADIDTTAAPVIIELKGVSQVYNDHSGEKQVLKDLDLTIRDRPKVGQFRVILGQSGCGKSTLLRYIAGLQKPTTGEILLRGKPRTEAKEDRIGMVFQKYSSLPWRSVLDNVTLGLEFQGLPPKDIKERGLAMLKLVGLEGHADKYAQYPTLSGGQLQRVAIARSLLASPQILLMDEPFGALDAKTRLQMQQLLLQLAEKLGSSCTIFVTHDIAEAVYLGDIIYIMGGSPAKILERIVSPFGERTPLLKKSADFTNMVHDIEEKMMIDQKGS